MTINSLKSTILYDEEVFRWTLCFLDHFFLKEEIDRQSVLSFKALHFLVFLSNFSAIWCFYSIFQDRPQWIDLFTVLGIFGVVIFLEVVYKKFAARLTEKIILARFSIEDLKDKTLLQLGGALERDHGILSMIDIFSGWQTFFRRSFIVILVVLFFFDLFSPFDVKIPLVVCLGLIIRVIPRSTTLTRLLKFF